MVAWDSEPADLYSPVEDLIRICPLELVASEEPNGVYKPKKQLNIFSFLYEN